MNPIQKYTNNLLISSMVVESPSINLKVHHQLSYSSHSLLRDHHRPWENDLMPNEKNIQLMFNAVPVNKKVKVFAKVTSPRVILWKQSHSL